MSYFVEGERLVSIPKFRSKLTGYCLFSGNALLNVDINYKKDLAS